jgi:hypothetical protein
MNDRFFHDLGKQFYEWHRSNRIRFEYGGPGKDPEPEVERIAGLIDYVEKKKDALLDKS